MGRFSISRITINARNIRSKITFQSRLNANFIKGVAITNKNKIIPILFDIHDHVPFTLLCSLYRINHSQPNIATIKINPVIISSMMFVCY